ncbi:dihydroorotase [Persicitalea jodogahamensis]|uniref:Dihydroorotase n=1 Tax=Persicitalea jodogahamensis TaxID=402147 RepID=A0A8J3D899_9BACT|nr:dihydroorotase [Persicitalea jodogahamensis]GHB67113.1 dihydroorotase [Persicitalea jodogahamensis]
MNSTLLLNTLLVNEGTCLEADVLIENGRISRIGSDLQHLSADRVIDAAGQHLLPGLIDDQVHFREPGLTHKATIATEARAAVAGGTTTFMEMPNTVPNALTQELLEDKYQIAADTSLANYSFYMGASNDNYDEVMRTDPQRVCGIKVFMGSSTGNMLVDAPQVLEKLFADAPCLIATHCEDEPTVRQRMEFFREKYGDDVPYDIHAIVRNEDACLKSSGFAVELATRKGTRLHILHISTGEETGLFDIGHRVNGQILLADGTPKLITAEACVHHLWFDAGDYRAWGTKIKCNPAIKAEPNKQQILQALLDDRIDVVATDHAPHTAAEKAQPYWQAPSGLPLVQHSLNVMLEFVPQGKISLERVVEKTSHAVADCFQIQERGYIREGYHADLVLVDLKQMTAVQPDTIFSKCGWSPFESTRFHSRVTHTFVSGHLAYEKGSFNEMVKGQRLTFSR